MLVGLSIIMDFVTLLGALSGKSFVQIIDWVRIRSKESNIDKRFRQLEKSDCEGEIGAVVGEEYGTDEDFSILMAETLCKTNGKVQLTGREYTGERSSKMFLTHAGKH